MAEHRVQIALDESQPDLAAFGLPPADRHTYGHEYQDDGGPQPDERVAHAGTLVLPSAARSAERTRLPAAPDRGAGHAVISAGAPREPLSAAFELLCRQRSLEQSAR